MRAQNNTLKRNKSRVKPVQIKGMICVNFLFQILRSLKGIPRYNRLRKKTKTKTKKTLFHQTLENFVLPEIENIRDGFSHSLI